MTWVAKTNGIPTFQSILLHMRNLVYLMQENFSQVQLPKVLNPLPLGPIQRGLRIRRSTKRLKYCMTMDVHYIYLVLQLHPPSSHSHSGLYQYKSGGSSKNVLKTCIKI